MLHEVWAMNLKHLDKILGKKRRIEKDLMKRVIAPLQRRSVVEQYLEDQEVDAQMREGEEGFECNF